LLVVGDVRILDPLSRSRRGSPAAGSDRIKNIRWFVIVHVKSSSQSALRFVLEFGLYALGYWGWTQNSGVMRILLAIGLPLLAAILWGTFRVPNDPGKAPVAVPGIVRLLLEFIYFSAATWAFYAAGQERWALIFGGVVLLHYAISYDRTIRLVRQH
jgi:hypothetical protein